MLSQPRTCIRADKAEQSHSTYAATPARASGHTPSAECSGSLLPPKALAQAARTSVRASTAASGLTTDGAALDRASPRGPAPSRVATCAGLTARPPPQCRHGAEPSPRLAAAHSRQFACLKPRLKRRFHVNTNILLLFR